MGSVVTVIWENGSMRSDIVCKIGLTLISDRLRFEYRTHNPITYRRDWRNAPWKRPSVSPPLASNCRPADMAPDDSPQLPMRCECLIVILDFESETYIVTFELSPPNVPIFFCTQRNAWRSIRCRLAPWIMGQALGTYGLVNQCWLLPPPRLQLR